MGKRNDYTWSHQTLESLLQYCLWWQFKRWLVSHPRHQMDVQVFKNNHCWTYWIPIDNHSKDLGPTPQSSVTSRNCSQISQRPPNRSASYSMAEPDITLTDSLQWDPLGTTLVSTLDPSYMEDLYDIPLDQAQNLQHVLPVTRVETPPQIQRSLPNLLQVANLDRRLPLTSTPKPPRNRLSNLRQSLPLETTRRRDYLPVFLRRFLAGRK